MSRRPGAGRLASRLPSLGAWWQLGALVLVALLTVGLVIWALVATRGEPVQEGAIPVEYFNADAEPSVEPVDFAIPPRQLIALDGETAWRSLASSCPAEVAVVERTTDGGSSWEAAALTGTSTVIKLTPGTAAKVSALVASSADCGLRYRSSVDGGAEWAPAIDRLPSLDLLDPIDPSIVRLGGVEHAAPCLDPAALSATPGGHALRCASGIVFTIADGGAEWTQLALPAPAVAVAGDGTGPIAFLSGAADCGDGIAVLAPGAVPIYGEPEPGATPTPGPGADDAEELEELPIIGYEDEARACLALDPAAPLATTTALDGTIWLWSGETVARSSDGGASWSGLG